MDSFIFLARFCPSLPIIWKLFWLVVWPVWMLWWWMAEGAFRCSLYLSPKVLEIFPMYYALCTTYYVHRGNLQDLWWKIQRAPEGPLCHSSPQHPNCHTTNQNNFQIIGREGQNLARNIKESIYIRVNNPSLNNNIGKFNLSHIWDRVLLNTKGLTLK